jgi:HPt (histidine-containing phosphotransfer) domain-containing protein
MTAPSPADLSAIAENLEGVDRLPIVDFDHLGAFTDGDPEMEAELADLFLTTTRRYLSAMQTALEAGQAWSAEAHALKGASGNFGACRVAALARDAEFEPPSPARLEVLRLAIADVASLFARRGA